MIALQEDHPASETREASAAPTPFPVYAQMVWGSRTTLYYLFLREFKARYRHAHLGYLWALLQPFALMCVLTLVFRFFAPLRSDVPYPLFAFLNLAVWSFHAGSLTAAMNALLSNGSLLKRVYFPRAILPMAVVAGLLVDLLIALVGVAVLSLVFRHPLPVHALLVFVPILWQSTLALSLALSVAMLAVYFRDLRHLMAVALQVWMFASPVIYPLSLVPEPYRALYMLNPMAGVLSLYGELLLHGRFPVLSDLAPSLLSTAILGVVGTRFFLRHDRSCVDLL